MAKTTSPQGNTRLLDFDLGACVFELLLERFGISLGNAFLDRLRSAIDQILGFLQAQAGSGTDDLDDLNLLVTGTSQNDGEFGLLFSSSSSASTGRASNGDGSGGNAELLFECLDQVIQFHNGQGANGFQDVFFANCHFK